MTQVVRMLVVWCSAGADRTLQAQVLNSLEQLAPRWEVLESGWCAVPSRGPSRYFGGDAAAARRAAELTVTVLPKTASGVRVGVADGLFAAELAARAAEPEPAASTDGPTVAIRVVPPGGSREMLAPLPLSTLERPDLEDLLRRLGLRTLGDLAALPLAKVVGRFGAEGQAAHRLACGLDERLPAPRLPSPDLTAQIELDPPADRVEAAAFVARSLADDLHQRLAQRGSVCTRLLIGAETEHGESHERIWRTGGAPGAAAIAERVRWQLQGWVGAGQGDPRAARPTGGVSRLWLVPEEVVPAGGCQLDLGAAAVVEVEAAERASRAVARLQGVVGAENVRVPERRGGRGPAEQVGLVPAGTVDLTGLRPPARQDGVGEPWPGAVPAPAPAAVLTEPQRVEVLDAAGKPVQVSGRGELSAPPQLVGGRRVVAWSAPWPCDERWWDRLAHRRRVRLQVLLADGTAHLLVLERGRWSLEATYD